jgi:hypothetical protein
LHKIALYHSFFLLNYSSDSSPHMKSVSDEIGHVQGGMAIDMKSVSKEE